MSETMTIVIERRSGDDVDLDEVEGALSRLGYKARTFAPGDHILPSTAIYNARRALESVLALLPDMGDPQRAAKKVIGPTDLPWATDSIAAEEGESRGKTKHIVRDSRGFSRLSTGHGEWAKEDAAFVAEAVNAHYSVEVDERKEVSDVG